MKILSYISILFLLLTSCQKEKLLPTIDLSFEVTEDGLLYGKLLVNHSSYQINYGDGSPVDGGVAYANSVILLQHHYAQKGTFNIEVTATNQDGTSKQKKAVQIKTIAYQPVAEFTYSFARGRIVKLDFMIKDGDAYEIDLGDGRIVKDSIKAIELSKNYPISISAQYKTNGNYKVKLTVSNPEGKAISEQIINIITPTADFSYDILDNGKLQLNNLSSNAQTYQWNDPGYNYGWYTSRSKNPTFIFENNGTYVINLTVYDAYGNTSTKLGSVTITNAKDKEKSIFKGIYFDKNGSFAGEGTNTFEAPWGAYLYGHPCFSFVHQDLGNIFIMYDYSYKLSVDEKYQLLKEKIIVGNQKKPQGNNPRVSKNQSVWSGQYGKDSFSIDQDPNAVFEIIEVEEVEQVRLFPEMHDKAFWVTYKIKADLGENGKVDGTLKAKYLIY